MNALQMARTAYATPGAPVRTGRSTEYDLFARITGRIRTAHSAGASNFNGLVEALNDNLRLWTTLAVDLADKENGLPKDLRARLVYLADFTRVHTSRVLTGKAAPDILIEINTSVMRGLAGGEGGQ